MTVSIMSPIIMALGKMTLSITMQHNAKGKDNGKI
jgi:hypothetical protein